MDKGAMETGGRHHKSSIAILFVALALLLPVTAGAAPSGEPEAFEKAYELYLTNQYVKAIEAFDRFLADFPKSTAADSVYFWKAKCLLHLKKEDEARQLFSELGKRFPDSPYRKIAERDFLGTRPAAEERTKSTEDASKKTSRVIVVGSHEKKIGELEEERSALRQRLDELQQRQQLSEKAMGRAMRELEDSERLVKAQQKKVDDLEHERKRLSDENLLLKLRAEEADAKAKSRGSSPATPHDEDGALRLQLADLQKKIADLESERKVSAESARNAKAISGEEAPALLIGDRKYTPSQIMRSIAVSSRVLAKLKVTDCPWRKEGMLEGFIIERKLLALAASRNISPDQAQIASLSKQHGLDPDETEYLGVYLTADRMVKDAPAGREPTEQEARSYYEKNRESFREPFPGNPVQLIAVRYSADTEVEQGLLAVEIRLEALGGGKLEEIAKKHAEAVYRSHDLRELPEWIQYRLVNGRRGEISEVFAAGQEYIVARVDAPSPSYRSYEAVRGDVLERLRNDPSRGKARLASWFMELAGDGVTLGGKSP